MAGPTGEPPRAAPHPGDGWVDCGCGQRHWGLHGAAGLLLVRAAAAGDRTAVLLQHRALWSHHGGTWGVPGGAREPGESAVDAALREAHEEAGVQPAVVRVLGSSVLSHPGWSYTTVLAVAMASFDPHPTDDESIEVRWVEADDVAAMPLLPAFGTAWPTLYDRLRGALA